MILPQTNLNELLPYLTLEEAERLKQNLISQDKILCGESLATFTRRAWKNIDPSPYSHGWHIDVISEHLEAVNRGEIKRLLINIPPRHCKSSLVNVCWPAWTWCQQLSQEMPLIGPAVQWMFASYAIKLSLRDARKCRRLIKSNWYQERWEDNFNILSDSDSRIMFSNNAGGYRFSTSVDGSTTGEGGSIIVLDDPHKVKGAESKTKRQSTLDWYDETLQTRLNDPTHGAIVIIMQRLNENDLSGHVLDKGGFEHLCLPARFESNRICVTKLGMCDPREEDGEPLWPERFNDDALSGLERDLGSYATAAQLQQRPAPRGGGIIKKADWRLWGNPDDPDDKRYKSFPPMLYILGSIDTAYTEEEENDYSAFSSWGVWYDENDLPKLMLMAAWRDRLEFNALVNRVGKSCRRFKVNKLLIENKASGRSVSQELKRLYKKDTWSSELVDPVGDKVARAHSVQHLFEEGVIYAPDRAWADLVIDELAVMPKGAHDDLADSAVQAVRWLRDSGWALRRDERELDLQDRLKLPEKVLPLYDV